MTALTPNEEDPGTEAAAPSEEDSDKDLVSRAQKGDEEAFSTLVERHQRKIYRLSLRMMGNDHEAEEILQEAFLSAYEKIPEFRGDAAFGSWVYRIAANAALMRLRRRSRSPEVLASGDETRDGDPQESTRFDPDGGHAGPPGADWSLRADDALHNKELGEAIQQAVANLSDDYRVVFMLKDIDGLSNEDIAEALSLSVPAVKSRLHRARLTLREKLGEFFVVE